MRVNAELKPKQVQRSNAWAANLPLSHSAQSMRLDALLSSYFGWGTMRR
jgi:hypothetical protein